MGSGPWCDACVRVAAREKNERREKGRWGVARGREVDRGKGMKGEAAVDEDERELRIEW